MPRKARKKSSTGIYHIIMRGINHQAIFEDTEDYQRLIKTLLFYLDECRYKIYAYCIMTNHVHLLLEEGHVPIATVMRKICASYVYWYNLKYDRVGNLFQDRFKSEPVDSDKYFLQVIRYIHQNPVKAGLVKNAEQYTWSSYSEYLSRARLTDADFVLNMFGTDRQEAINSFIKFNSTPSDDSCLEVKSKNRVTDEKAREIIKKVCKIKDATQLRQFDASKRNLLLRELKQIHHLTIRQIQRLTGINRGIIQKA